MIEENGKTDDIPSLHGLTAFPAEGSAADGWKEINRKRAVLPEKMTNSMN